MKQTPGKTYKCKNCNSEEFIPEGEFGIKTSQIKSVLCPICLLPKRYCKICKKRKRKCKGHELKMEELTKK